MNLTNLSNLTNKKFSRQVALYEAAGLAPDMEISLPFATNVDTFFDTEALIAHGIDPMGLARQLDQVMVENIGNNFSQKVKTAAAKNKPLPGQALVDEMLAAYDFTGIRTTSEEGMSTEERTTITEIRKALRSLISGGTFANIGPEGDKTSNPENIVFSAGRVQTGPEAKGDKETPPCSVPLENFDNLVAAAYQAVETEIQDGNGNTANLDFSVPPIIDELGQAQNLTGVIELARQEAARVLERNRTKTIPTVAIAIQPNEAG